MCGFGEKTEIVTPHIPNFIKYLNYSLIIHVKFLIKNVLVDD
jgi:hypothetical protein